MIRGRASALAVVLAGIVVSFGLSASAGLITLTDDTSTMELDPSSSAGVFSWRIGEVSHLSQQWFWFRSDLDGFGAREYSIHELDAAPDIFQHPALPNFARVTYSDGRLEIEVTYILVGSAGLRSSDLAEVISITNLTEDTITVDFFQFSNFNLGGDGEDDLIEITGGNTSFQSDSGSLATVAETIVSRTPELSEVAIGTQTLAKLLDGDVDDLDGTSSGVGPGDLTWAFQWKGRQISAGHSLLISKDKVLVSDPVAEPGALGVALIVTLAARRRRRS